MVRGSKIPHNTNEMKNRKHLMPAPKGKSKFGANKSARPKMTAKIAELRAVGDPKRPKFDGTAFLASLRK
jgi:hypothetical protein